MLLKEYVNAKQTELAIGQIHDISSGFKNVSNAELSESARTILGLSETIKMQPGYNLGDYWIDKTTILNLWISGATKIENIRDATKQIVQVISEGRMLYDYSRTGDDINLRRLNLDYRLFYKLTTLLPEKDFCGLVEAIANSNTKDNIKAELAKLLIDMNSALSTDFQKRLRPTLKILVKQANKNYPYFLGNF